MAIAPLAAGLAARADPAVRARAAAPAAKARVFMSDAPDITPFERR
jgi:hypothetical protein